MKSTRVLAVRLLFPRDVRRALADQEGKRGPQWVRTDLLAAFDQPGTQAWAAEIDNTLVGYVLFQLTDDVIHVLHIAVAPYWRRQGVARTMLEKLDEKQPRLIRMVVPEGNLAVQLLFRDAGYRAIRVLRGYHGGADAYVMQRTGSADGGCSDQN
jgi:ribosomal-protein-alanine N-acetyltransferase